MRLHPGLEVGGQAWYISLKSKEFALAVEPVSTIGDWSRVVELNVVLVGSSVKMEIVAGFGAL